VTGVLAIIPARGGSKGLPGKNIRPFLGKPLIAHSILYAKMCPEIDRLIVSTDSLDIATVARQYDAEVPFMRPHELAKDETPMMPVLAHALAALEGKGSAEYGFVVLLDPTSPAREPNDVRDALQKLKEHGDADGIVSISQPDFNPVWNCVIERKGWMEDLVSEANQFARRQDAPKVYRINGALYIWRAAFVRRNEPSWREKGRHLVYEIPESRAMSIDTLEEFKRAEVLVQAGLIHFPWLNNQHA
jgi:CMP-N-acetylneuraminic acid synthetase